MEQLVSFLSTVIFCSLAILVFKSPEMLLVGFVVGTTYHVVRAKQEGWKLPKDIRNTH